MLHDRIKGARAGRAGLVVIRGAAGVGKSRLLVEGLTLAERLGFRILHGRADELDRGMPYAALRDALSVALRAEDNPLLAELTAKVQGVLTGTSPNEPGDELGATVGSLQNAFGAGEQLLRQWADRDPLLVAIDDLHAADPDTITVITLLARLLRDTRVLLVTTTARRTRPIWIRSSPRTLNASRSAAM